MFSRNEVEEGVEMHVPIANEEDGFLRFAVSVNCLAIYGSLAKQALDAITPWT